MTSSVSSGSRTSPMTTFWRPKRSLFAHNQGNMFLPSTEHSVTLLEKPIMTKPCAMISYSPRSAEIAPMLYSPGNCEKPNQQWSGTPSVWRLKWTPLWISTANNPRLVQWLLSIQWMVLRRPKRKSFFTPFSVSKESLFERQMNEVAHPKIATVSVLQAIGHIVCRPTTERIMDQSAIGNKAKAIKTIVG